MLAIAFGVSCATPRSSPPVHIVIVHTTDLHGQYRRLPVLQSYVNALRRESDNRLVLVDSGDMFKGTPESELFEGEPVVRAYNAMGFSAAAVGNHEFDFGIGALERNASMAKFPLLSANIVEKQTGKTPSWARPYTIVDVAGVRLGILGLTTPETPKFAAAANIASVRFTDPVAATIESARALRQLGADAVIVIAHMGGKCTDISDIHDVASCDPNEELLPYLQQLPPGTIDLYLGGHSHDQVRHIIHGFPAMQAGPRGTEFSTVDLYVDHHRVDASKTTLRPITVVCETCIAPDPAVTAVVKPFLDRAASLPHVPDQHDIRR